MQCCNVFPVAAYPLQRAERRDQAKRFCLGKYAYSFALFANRGSLVERGRVIFDVFSRFP